MFIAVCQGLIFLFYRGFMLECIQDININLHKMMMVRRAEWHTFISCDIFFSVYQSPASSSGCVSVWNINQKYTWNSDLYQRSGLRLEVLAGLMTEFLAFWGIAPCSMLVGYRRFRGPCWRWRQNGPPKRRYLTSALRSAVTQKVTTSALWSA
jgi:hypothetical protein